MNPTSNRLTGTILHLQRLSTEDGPGIRTTVFFKGCPLACRWCHNPESISTQAQVQWLDSRCIRCLSCVETCPQQGVVRQNGHLSRDRERCTVCGACVEACPAGATELLGREISVDELVKDLLKDRSYYEKSDGGVTLSGGEPTLQASFSLALTRQLKQAGVSVALDTCALCSQATLEHLLPEIDTLLVDLKMIDSLAHERWTGVGNAVILQNVQWLAEVLPARYSAHRLWVRTPLIPDATLTAENIQAISAFLAPYSAAVERWELCAFNNLCRDKYERLDMPWDFANAGLLSRGQLEQAGAWAAQGGFNPSKIFITGASRVEKQDSQVFEVS